MSPDSKGSISGDGRVVGIKSRTRYQDEFFDEIHSDRSTISESDFFDCTFNKCSFEGTEFLKCRFSNCAFDECNLSLVEVLESTFAGTRFTNSKVIGVNWTMADWSRYLLGEPLCFEKCAINHSTFIGLHMKGISIVDCVASDVDFRETNLTQSDLTGTDFTESQFGNTNLKEADLRRAENYAIDPTKNTLSRAKFSLPEAMSLLFSMDIELT